jgi:dephospho-CoA kinase
MSSTPSRKKPIILGLAGYAGAGKDSFALLLKSAFTERQLQAVIVSSGDLIRQYVTENQLGDPGDRAVLRKTVDDVGASHGYTFWLDRALQEGKDQDVILYPGLRQAVEVDFIHAHHNFVIGIKVPIETRYARAQARNRPGDDISFETFVANEEAERAGTAQQIDAVMSQLDVTILNNGSLEQLTAVAAGIAADFPDHLQKTYDASTL